MKTAKKLALPVAQTYYQVFGQTPALVSERWDRLIDNSTNPATVRRLHQEDFCQAMGVMTDQKYQSDGGPGAVDIVHFMRSNGFSEHDVVTFFNAMIFNFLIAGSDTHARNYAILEPNGKQPSLAPLYDIASMFAYNTQRKDRKLAMRIGSEYHWERIEIKHWQQFAKQCGGPQDWNTIKAGLYILALYTPLAFMQAANEALQQVQSLPNANGESQENKKQLVNRISAGITAQSQRVLTWFAE